MIESHRIIIIRTNPDAVDFDMNRLINQMYKRIIESIKKQTKYTSTLLNQLKNKPKYQLKNH